MTLQRHDLPELDFTKKQYLEVLITPTAAKYLMTLNRGNRKIRPERIRQHIARIKLNSWKLTHQGIAVANTGRLLDGQHRLLAIIETGQPQWLVISTGWEEAIYSAIDCGAPRSMAERTQLSRAVVEEAQNVCRIAANTFHAPLPEDSVFTAALAFSPESDLLHNVCNTAKKRRSQASARVAAILRMALDGDDYAAREYRNYVLWSHDISPIALSMMKQQETGGPAHRARAPELLARYWKMFDRTQRNSRKLIVPDNRVALAEMRAVIIDRVGPLQEWLGVDVDSLPGDLPLDHPEKRPAAPPRSRQRHRQPEPLRSSGIDLLL